MDQFGEGEFYCVEVLRIRPEPDGGAGIAFADIADDRESASLEVLKEFKSAHPRLPVLMLSMHPEEEYAVRAFRAGASGYLTKDSAAKELVGAIGKVLAGGRYVSASLAEKLAIEMDVDAGKPPHETLSDREYQVLRMIASGKTVSEIAQELSLSIKTISTYRSRILEKMRAKNNAELTRYVFENRLLI